MPKRTIGKSKLTAEMRQRLAEVAREAHGRLVYGEKWCCSRMGNVVCAEIESDDPSEVGRRSSFGC